MPTFNIVPFNVYLKNGTKDCKKPLFMVYFYCSVIERLDKNESCK